MFQSLYNVNMRSFWNETHCGKHHNVQYLGILSEKNGGKVFLAFFVASIKEVCIQRNIVRLSPKMKVLCFCLHLLFFSVYTNLPTLLICFTSASRTKALCLKSETHPANINSKARHWYTQKWIMNFFSRNIFVWFCTLSARLVLHNSKRN